MSYKRDKDNVSYIYWSCCTSFPPKLKQRVWKIRLTKVDAGNLKNELSNRIWSTLAVNVLGIFVFYFFKSLYVFFPGFWWLICFLLSQGFFFWGDTGVRIPLNILWIYQEKVQVLNVRIPAKQTPNFVHWLLLFLLIWTTKLWFSWVKLRVPLKFFFRKKALLIAIAETCCPYSVFVIINWRIVLDGIYLPNFVITTVRTMQI
jgi:hypothetical protein